MVQKDVTPDGRLWFTTNTNATGASVAQVGFTKLLLDEVRDECWSIIPSHSFVRRGQPLFAIETNDALLSIVSPFDGRVSGIDFQAQNCPDKLTEDSVVLTIICGESAKPSPKVVSPELRPGRQPVLQNMGIDAFDQALDRVLEERAREGANIIGRVDEDRDEHDDNAEAW